MSDSRWKRTERKIAALLGGRRVPVIVRDIADPLEAERVIIESNRQRDKTPSEVMHEADNLTRIFEEEARRKILEGASGGGQTAGRGRPKGEDSPTPTLVQGSRAERMTATKVAEAVGMKRSTHRKVKTVYDTANDAKVAAPIRAVAQRQMAALDTGETTPNAADRAVREAERRAGDRHDHALIVLRLGAFVDWFGDAAPGAD